MRKEKTDRERGRENREGMKKEMLSMLAERFKSLPGDSLLHQVSTLHVQEQSSILCLDLAGRNHLKEAN